MWLFMVRGGEEVVKFVGVLRNFLFGVWDFRMKNKIILLGFFLG